MIFGSLIDTECLTVDHACFEVHWEGEESAGLDCLQIETEWGISKNYTPRVLPVFLRPPELTRVRYLDGVAGGFVTKMVW